MPGKFKKNRNILNRKEMTPLSILSQDKNGKFSLYQNGMKEKESASTMKNRNKSEESEQKNESLSEEIVDPLTWFGAMVPRPICTAQKDFKEPLNVLIEMAN